MLYWLATHIDWQNPNLIEAFDALLVLLPGPTAFVIAYAISRRSA